MPHCWKSHVVAQIFTLLTALNCHMLLVLARADQQTVHPLLGFGYPQILYLKIHNTLIIADSNF